MGAEVDCGRFVRKEEAALPASLSPAGGLTLPPAPFSSDKRSNKQMQQINNQTKTTIVCEEGGSRPAASLSAAGGLTLPPAQEHLLALTNNQTNKCNK